ncbi:YncE family protein [Paucibacter sp. B51]|uniref:YncE family protein n=1 Tax=Paucibacter sp. B51 TaxID=2993315 RepID=UPI0022EC0A00|nr:hypothetical protein [Paucibacter sp. B51]
MKKLGGIQRWRSTGAALCISGAVLGCGGGGGSGGGGSSSGTVEATAKISAVAWSASALNVERDVFATESSLPSKVALSLRNTGGSYWYKYSYDKAFADVSHSHRTADEGLDFSVGFPLFPAPAVGSYSDTLSVLLCYDANCNREVPGGPFNLPMRLDVGYFAVAEADVEPLQPAQTTVLTHDVLGAAYSAALDAVVTVSARPTATLRLHDLRSGQVRTVPLAVPPTSLSLSADGLRAAVGHDAAVTLLDLRAESPEPARRFDVPLAVGSLVLAGDRVVAMGSVSNNSNPIYWLDTKTGLASRFDAALGGFGIYGTAASALHPSGDRLYMADLGVSPDDVWRMDLSGDAGTGKARNSRYHGEHRFCGRLAVAPNGLRIYTACGTVLSSSPNWTDDLVYAGSMKLSATDTWGNSDYRAAALNVAPDNASIALLEEHWQNCRPLTGHLSKCYTRLAVYDATTLERRSLKGLAPYVRNRDRLQQWGRHLMHRSDGSLLLLAEVRTQNEATPTWLLHRVSKP